MRTFALLGLLATAMPGSRPARAADLHYVGVQGGHLVYNGAPVRLKGVSFYPHGQPWGFMWTHWNGPATRADMARVADFGANAVRIMVPYRVDQAIVDDKGALNPTALDRLRQLVQMAGELHLKVLFTLFDWYDDTPALDDVRWQYNLTFLHDLVGGFAGDDRVLGWDVHNEPDLYDSWHLRHDGALDWMARVSAAIHQLAPQQLVTVGVAHAASLWQADSLGRTLLDISDFAGFHSYDAGAVMGEIASIRAHTSKPVVLEETGWPTGPCGANDRYNDSVQQILYTAMVQAATNAGLDGLLAWQLWDFPPDASNGSGVESEQDHFGLLRLDGSIKPGAEPFRDGFRAGVVPLDSGTTSALPLTIAPPRPAYHPPNWVPPLEFPQTGHSVWDEFRDYWQQFGGLAVFGYPITEARMENGMKVQYFQRARFEWHPENGRLKGYQSLTTPEKLRLLVQLTRLGAPLAEARHFPPGPAAASAAADTLVFAQTGHTLRGVFKQFWEDHAGLTNFGYPLSEELQEVSSTDGRAYTVQYFERVRFEYHPENAGSPYVVLLGQLGTEMLAARGCR